VAPLVCDWDRLETDVLFELCERFDLRFINIADRLSEEVSDKIIEQHTKATQNVNVPKLKKRDLKSKTKAKQEPLETALPRRERTVDEIKDRYYSVARGVLVLRGSDGHPIVTKPFNYEAEVRRKKDLEKYMMRSRQQQEKGKHLLQEIKKIESKIKKLEKEEKN